MDRTMTAYLVAFVHCDGCGDSEQADYSKHTIASARADCRSMGWHRTRDGKDWCPGCWLDRDRAATDGLINTAATRCGA